MKTLLTITLLLTFSSAFPQDKKVIFTDTSRIEIDEVVRGRQSIHEYLKGKNLVKWTFINENGFTEVKGQYDTLKNSIGIWYQYDEQGQLLRTENFDNRTWTVIKKEYYPYKALLDNIKSKADNIVIKTYGQDFFKKHAKWDFSQSYIYFQDEAGTNWTDITTKKPTSFLIRYDIQYDQERFYDDMIEFELDIKGNFKGNQYEEIYGFEKLSPTSPKTFTLTHSKAIQLAKQKGLVENDSTKAEAFLHWENHKTNKFYNGNFRYYVIIKTNSVKNLQPEGRSSIIDKFDVYVFNPWTAEFVATKKMKAVRSWEKMSGSSTGLLPDE
jgi:hypothetical protein